MIVGGTAAPSSALTLTNTAPSGLYNCNPSSSTITASCISGALRDFKAARRKEGLRAMVLPSNFTSMSVPAQVFVLTNIERRDRGIPTFLALSSNLRSFVTYAANHATDPRFPSWTREGGSNWASPRNSLWADYLWMYDDGMGAGNVDCTSKNQTGCWGHRRNIVGRYGAPRIMAAAVGSTGIATLMMGQDSHDVPASLLPNAPASISAHVQPARNVSMTWPVPPYRGAPVLGYYVRYDTHTWGNTHLRRSWTTPPLAPGYHTVSVRSLNKYGASALRSVRLYVR